MPFDAGLADRVRDALRTLGERGIREKGLFGGRGFLLGKHVCVAVYEDSLLVKCPPDEYATVLGQAGITPFAPGGERPMSTWVVVPDEAVADDPELVEWVARGLRGVRSAPVKKVTSRRKKAAAPAKKTPAKKLPAKKAPAKKAPAKKTPNASRSAPPGR